MYGNKEARDGVSSRDQAEIQPNLRRTEFFLKKKQKGTESVVVEIPVSHAPWEAR